MAITLRILDGADRGRVFGNLTPPVTIGREEGNTVQLNDERVSRYHLKIQDDHNKLVLTDLESTNGTRVNGEDIQLRILRFGDTISLGRSVLLFGSRDEIAERIARIPRSSGASSERSSSIDFNGDWEENSKLRTLHALQPPEFPERLSPGQAAQLSELLEYLHVRIRGIIQNGDVDSDAEEVTLGVRVWQNLLDVQSRLAEYLRQVGDPQADDEE